MYKRQLLKQYKDPKDIETLKSLNALCVRLVFCLYAEDAGIFGGHGKFHDYMQKHNGIDARRALIDLFKVLDTKDEERDPYTVSYTHLDVYKRQEILFQ